MIIVSNTKELEENYNLAYIPDDEPIMVRGGLEGKSKYSAEKYQKRVTYPAGQLKQIISKMKEIEAQIPQSWNKWQKAKHIYEVLSKYISYNYSNSYDNQQSSNLTILLSRKGICAGYSLLFKEMMDRQSISCDYVRGITSDSTDKYYKHAWNVLHIGSYSIPVDLTWDATSQQKGKNLIFFGNFEQFEEYHIPDADDRHSSLNILSSDFVNSINTDIQEEPHEFLDEKEQQLLALKNAINETYTKYCNIYGEESAKSQVESAILRYIREGNALGFTRNNSARAGIKERFTMESMLQLLAQNYVSANASLSLKDSNALSFAVQQTCSKYSTFQAKSALLAYILQNNPTYFTNQNNARLNMTSQFSSNQVLMQVISSFVERELATRHKRTFF